jgi:Recombinase zinc beta ribbon domain
MRCQSCGKAMIGTRAHGRSRVYRYYTCFTRLRYEAARCDAARLDADVVEDAVIAALAGFFRHQHALIADAIAQAQASHAAGEGGRRAEITAAEHELAKTGAAIDWRAAAGCGDAAEGQLAKVDPVGQHAHHLMGRPGPAGGGPVTRVVQRAGDSAGAVPVPRVQIERQPDDTTPPRLGPNHPAA